MLHYVALDFGVSDRDDVVIEARDEYLLDWKCRESIVTDEIHGIHGTNSSKK